MGFIFEKEKKMQKNRFFRKPKKIKTSFGDASFLTDREGRIELVHLIFLKKRLKKFIQKRDKRLEFNREKIWFCVTPNFLIQQKSKNSRMGKGKGLVERHTIRIRKNVILFEFYGISYNFLKKTLFILNKKLDVKLVLFFDRPAIYNFWASRKKYITYHNKYMLNL